jgi:hypothetical protein
LKETANRIRWIGGVEVKKNPELWDPPNIEINDIDTLLEGAYQVQTTPPVETMETHKDHRM